MPFDSLSMGPIAVSDELRHRPEGSLDYDHYRRLATEIRTETYAAALQQLALPLMQTVRRISRATSVVEPPASLPRISR